MKCLVCGTPISSTDIGKVASIVLGNSENIYAVACKKHEELVREMLEQAHPIQQRALKLGPKRR